MEMVHFDVLFHVSIVVLAVAVLSHHAGFLTGVGFPVICHGGFSELLNTIMLGLSAGQGVHADELQCSLSL